mgnify:CR=1 FL=1
MENVKDLIIVGGGPAGLTAAIYGIRAGLSLVLAEKFSPGGQVVNSYEIENYPGFAEPVEGWELMSRMEEQARRLGTEIINGDIISVDKSGDIFSVKMDGAVIESRSVIVAAGASHRKLGVPGEKEFKNRGLTYCATCDGPIFAGKDVAVIGGGNSALDAALQLIKIARKIHIINNTTSLGGDQIMRQKVEKADNVVVHNNSRVLEIIGDKTLKSININKSSHQENIAVEGVFVEIGLIPNSSFIPEVAKNELGEILINSRNETNIPGIFAAGDVTNVPEKQIIIAAGEGSKSALSAFRYLAERYPLCKEK